MSLETSTTRTPLLCLTSMGKSLGFVGKKENEAVRSKMNVSEITGSVAEVGEFKGRPYLKVAVSFL